MACAADHPGIAAVRSLRHQDDGVQSLDFDPAGRWWHAAMVDIELRDIEPDEVAVLQGLIESDPDYTERVTGHPPGPSDAQSLLLMRPPDVSEEDKRVLGAWLNGSLVAVVDLVRGFPDDDTVHIGLLQVHGEQRRQGLGKQVHDLAVQDVRRWAPRATSLRAAIVATNATYAEPFWRSLKYEPSGDPRPYVYDKLQTTVTIWRRPTTTS
jgi:GNAT superfamily N-acetyltransferase